MDRKIRKEQRERRAKFVLWKTLTMVVVILVLSFLCVQYSPVLSSFDVKETKAESTQWAYALVYYVIPPILYSQIQEMDEEKRKRIAKKNMEKRAGYSEAVRGAFFSLEFWLDGGLFLLVLFILPTSNSIVRALFFGKNLSTATVYFLKGLLYLLPMAGLLLVIEGAFARDMYRQWRANGKLVDSENQPILPPVSQKRVRMNLFYLLLIAILLPSTIPIFNFIFAIAVAAMPYYRILLVIAALGLCAFLYRRSFGMARRKKQFHQTLEEICRQRGYRLEWKGRYMEGLYHCTGREEFVVDMGSRRFSGTFLSVHSRNSSLYFWENPVYRFEKRILFFHLFFPAHPLLLEAASEEDKRTERVVVLSHEPKFIAFGDEDAFREIGCGDSIRGFTVHHAVSFCHWIDRYHLFRDQP